MDFRAEYEKWCTDPYFDEATKAETDLRDRMVPGGWTGLPDPCISDERYRDDRDRYLRRIFT